MMYVWTLFLLAFATGSVYSDQTMCGCKPHEAIVAAVTEGLKSINLAVPGVLNIVTGLITTAVKEISVVNLKLESSETNNITNSGYISLTITASLGCNLAPKTAIKIKVSANLISTVKEGCFNQELDKTSLKVEVSIADTSVLGIDLNLKLGSVVKGIVPAITESVNCVLEKVLGKLNEQARLLKQTYFIDGKPAGSALKSVQGTGTAALKFVTTFFVGSKSCDLTGVTDKLKNGELSLWTISNTDAANIIGNCLNGKEFKVGLPSQVCDALGLDKTLYGSQFQLVLKINKVEACNFKDDKKVDLQLSVSIEIHGSGGLVFGYECNLGISASVSKTPGCFGLDTSGSTITLELKAYKDDNKCECGGNKDLHEKLFKENIGSCLTGIEAILKTIIKLIPADGGDCKHTECESKQGNCRCGCEKPPSN